MRTRLGPLRLAGAKIPLVTLSVPGVPVQTLEGCELVDKIEKFLWGSTVQREYERTIDAPRWQRKTGRRFWVNRPQRSLLLIVSPVMLAGISSLRTGVDMWSHWPHVECIVKILPPMMLRLRLDSDVTQDELVKESDVLDDYPHRVTAGTPLDGAAVVQVCAVQKLDVAVAWGRIVSWVRCVDAIPLKLGFFGERCDWALVRPLSEGHRVGWRVLADAREPEARHQAGQCDHDRSEGRGVRRAGGRRDHQPTQPDEAMGTRFRWAPFPTSDPRAP